MAYLVTMLCHIVHGLGIPGRQLASADSSGPFVFQGKHFNPQPFRLPLGLL